MLNKVAWPASTNASDAYTAPSQEATIDLIEILRLVRRQWILIASVLMLVISGGLVYLGITPPHYTASSTLLIDPRQAPPFQPQSSANLAIDSAYVDSQVEMLKSDTIAKSVINKLDLLSDPEFIGPDSSVLGTIRSGFSALFGGNKASTESDKLGRAVSVFQARLTIKRIGLTHVIQIDYRSVDATKAARISNAVMEAHIVGQLESKYRTARHASGWLRDRIGELKTQAQTAERAVAEFKANNNIVDTGAPPLNEQQLANLSSQRRVALKDLESSAQIYRTLYETLLQRSTEITQQQSFPAIEARVITEASPPVEKSDPKALLVLGAATALGLVGGLAAAFAREHLNTVFLSSSQLENEVGISCLGILPTIPGRRPSAKWHKPDGKSCPSHDDRNQIVPREQAASRRVISRDPARYTFVVDQPFSPSNEMIRFLAADFAAAGRRKKVIGVSSALPREGKSMVAASLSEMIADAGRKVLLIDCDLRNLGLTRLLAPKATAGLIDAVAGQAAVEDLIWCDPVTKLDFLPVVLPFIRTVHPSGTLSSAAMQKLLESMQDRYDHVILDLPPIIPVADVKAASHLIETFILVIEWGHTSQAAVLEALNAAPLVAEKLLGAVLNKANPTVLARLESYKGRYYRN